MDRLITTDPRAAPGQGVVRYDARRRGLPCRARDVGITTECKKVFGTEALRVLEGLRLASFDCARMGEEDDQSAVAFAAQRPKAGAQLMPDAALLTRIAPLELNVCTPSMPGYQPEWIRPTGVSR